MPLGLKTTGSVFDPKNEIQRPNLPLFTGRKHFGKTSPDRFGYGFDFSEEFSLQHLVAS